MIGQDERIVQQGNQPGYVSRRVEVEFNRQRERIAATGEIGMAGMSAMSAVAQYAPFKVAITAAAAELLAKGTAATRPNAPVAPAEQDVQQRLFVEYTHRMAQVSEMTNIKILQSVDRATERLGKRTFADALEDFYARLTDAMAGRLNRPALPNDRR